MPCATPEITPRCPIRTTLDMIGGKWKLLLIAQLVEQPKRFGELKKQIPEISDKMLHQELQVLIQNGLIHKSEIRDQDQTICYHVSDRGKLVFPLIEAMATFAKEYDQYSN